MAANDTTAQLVLGPDEGRTVLMGGLGVRFMVDGERSGGGFALVEHPLAPRALGAPMHTHTHEDEYTYVLEGEIGIQVGDEVVTARAGDLVFKPRGVPHAFWNAGEEEVRLLELISPGGFDRYFADMAPLLGGAGPPDFEALAGVRARYRLTMDYDSIATLSERFGLRA